LEKFYTLVDSGALVARQVYEIPRPGISAIPWHKGCCVSID
jgi:hypothetical protein